MAKNKEESIMPDDYMERVKVGYTIKNYKKMCEIFGWNETTGNSKISQIEEFDKHFKYNKIGNSFLIYEVVEKEKSEVSLKTEFRYEVDISKLNLRVKSEKEKYCELILERANDKLSVGEAYSYDTLCLLLGDKKMKSNQAISKRVALWNTSCFKLSKIESGLYVIEEIYETPRAIDNRDGNGVFIKYTKPLMLNYLMKHPEGMVSVTRTQLIKELGFVNNNWSLAYDDNFKNSLLKQHANLNPTLIDLWDFIDNAGNSFKRVLNTTLNNMSEGINSNGDKKGMFLIRVKRGYTFVKTMFFKLEEKKASPDDYTKIPKSMFYMMVDKGFAKEEDYSCAQFHIDASEEDNDAIFNLYGSALEDMNLESLGDASWNEYLDVYDDVNSSVCTRYDCDYFYERYVLKYDINRVKKHYDKREDYHNLVIEFNEIVAKSQSKNASNRAKRAFEKVYGDERLLEIARHNPEEVKGILLSNRELEQSKKRLLARVNPDYIKFNDELINTFISINNENE